jgi:hypothetical protein
VDEIEVNDLEMACFHCVREMIGRGGREFSPMVDRLDGKVVLLPFERGE